MADSIANPRLSLQDGVELVKTLKAMSYSIDTPTAEKHNVFTVTQVSPSTFLEEFLGADFVQISANSISEIHKHQNSENVILVLRGRATIILNDEEFTINAGNRVQIGRGVYHGFRTQAEQLEFISIQMPPILDKKKGIFDRIVKT